MSSVTIESASLAAMKVVIDFIYSESFSVQHVDTFECALEVFQLADRFDLDRLTELVVPMIARHLTVATVLEALQFSETHRHTAGGAILRKMAQEYARSHWEDMLDFASNMSQTKNDSHLSALMDMTSTVVSDLASSRASAPFDSTSTIPSAHRSGSSRAGLQVQLPLNNMSGA